MKRAILRAVSVLIVFLTVLCCLPACKATSLYAEGEGELKIVASSFIPFDLARNITKGNARITVLQTDGGDLHDYTPTTATLAALAEADIFICIGGISDGIWIDDAIKASENKSLTVIKLTDGIDGALAETEGHSHTQPCEQLHTHIHDHDHEHSTDDGHDHTMDEHVWTSLRNAVKAVQKITEVCAEKDSKNADRYKKNSDFYISELQALDAQYTETVAKVKNKTLIFADRFPFIYLTKDYGLCYYAAFSGCSSEIDADFETAVRLTEAVKHNNLKYIIVTEGSDKKLASSISDAEGYKILTLDSMQSVSRSEIEAGADYLQTMKENLKNLKTALS